MSVLSERILREASQEEELADIVAVDLRNKGLTELGPIDKCKGLKVLDLSYNQLKGLKGLEGLDKLKELRLSDNRIQVLSGFQRLAELNTLVLDGNILSLLEGLQGLRSLKVLNASFNSLSSLTSIGRLTALDVLHVAGNQITDLEGLSACPALRIVNACSNRLQHLKGLARCALLQELHVADNKLKDLTGLKAVAGSLEVRDAGAKRGGSEAGAEAEAQPPPNFDPTLAEMEAFRKRLGIRTYAPQFAGRPGTAGSSGRPGTAGSAGRPGSSSGGRPGTAGGRPGTAGSRPGTGPQQFPRMPLAPEYGAAPRHAGPAAPAATSTEKAEAEKAEAEKAEALLLFERLFGGAGADTSGGGGGSGQGTPRPRAGGGAGGAPCVGGRRRWRAAAVMDAMEVEDDDPIVRELDVYVCNEFAGSSTQLGLLQHPLRPPWRPYDYAKTKAMRFKPQAKRIEVDLPLESDSRNYNDVIEDLKKVKQFTLRSTLTEDRTNLAVGTVKGGKLLIAPLDFALQLRPSLHHLNVAASAKEKGNADSDEDEDDEPKLHAVEVQVQKRETERQAQARKNSHAYITQKEDEEPFVNLNVHGEESEAALRIWDKFMSAREVDHAAHKLDRQAYLRAIVPPASAAAKPGGGPPEGSQQAGPLAAGVGSGLSQLSEGARAALPTALRALLREHTVCSMANVRSWLDSSPAAAAAKEAALLADRALHDAVLALGHVASMHRVYVVSKTGDEKTDPLRKLVLELLEAKESFKRSEFNDLARTNNMTFTESLYNRVVKDICESRGNTWHVKNGASGV
ncbi:Protein phosphatase 1 regulatory subunit 7 [Tetrabaena socialis]|uniref:Protein phosphatase 1 regulatory subunit 7 n=1 Tax=Tetrabaena socialis TaxID=47790 RepID=A0A2J7ZW00_9CHLO|nr:Protein phosphatase 1 regulatory subunit 7 [Tetrabaena socialis]|eukprot:PNH04418.1 Protein phosphatase 1 regulatory subunit 7 [Tetrabaena socialis]